VQYLIRFITLNPAGGVEHHDKVIDAAVITIGRATDQVLQLKDKRARLQHAVIEEKGDGVHITTSALAGVTVNGRSQRDARLTTGDVIEVGANILRVIDAPADVEFAISFELSAEARSEDLVEDWSAAHSGVVELSKRKLSWYAVLAVLVLTLLIPAAGLLGPDIASLLRGSILPDDSLWLAGHRVAAARQHTAGRQLVAGRTGAQQAFQHECGMRELPHGSLQARQGRSLPRVPHSRSPCRGARRNRSW
jgi:pSer/pThr/pTyr-binding forkhead associated (FHA) protein